MALASPFTTSYIRPLSLTRDGLSRYISPTVTNVEPEPVVYNPKRFTGSNKLEAKRWLFSLNPYQSVDTFHAGSWGSVDINDRPDVLYAIELYLENAYGLTDGRAWKREFESPIKWLMSKYFKRNQTVIDLWIRLDQRHDMTDMSDKDRKTVFGKLAQAAEQGFKTFTGQETDITRLQDKITEAYASGDPAQMEAAKNVFMNQQTRIMEYGEAAKQYMKYAAIAAATVVTAGAAAGAIGAGGAAAGGGAAAVGGGAAAASGGSALLASLGGVTGVVATLTKLGGKSESTPNEQLINPSNPVPVGPPPVDPKVLEAGLTKENKTKTIIIAVGVFVAIIVLLIFSRK